MVTWNHIIVYKLFALDSNINQSYIKDGNLLDRNTWKYIMACKLV